MAYLYNYVVSITFETKATYANGWNSKKETHEITVTSDWRDLAIVKAMMELTVNPGVRPVAVDVDTQGEGWYDYDE